MTDKRKICILKKALEIAGQYARDNPPAEINIEYIDCIVDAKSDPLGIRFVNRWLEEAIGTEIE